MSKPKGFMSKLNGVTLVFTLVGTSLFTFVAVSQRSEASETLRSSKSASAQGASPAHNSLAHDRSGIAPPHSAGELQQSTKPIVTVQSLVPAESRVPSETRLDRPANPVAAAPVPDVRPMEAPAAAALPSTPARNGPAPTEVAAYVALAHAKIQQGDIAAARRLLEWASSGDEAEAWLVLAETYDPQMLARWGVVGIKPDLEKAKTFYQEAQRRGAQGARERLLSFSTVGSPQ
jgi:hypothetical protein